MSTLEVILLVAYIIAGIAAMLRAKSTGEFKQGHGSDFEKGGFAIAIIVVWPLFVIVALIDMLGRWLSK